MIPLSFVGRGTMPRRVLCIGAHSDDIEIGCGGTILRLLEAYPQLEVRWVVLSADERRANEARCAAKLFLSSASAEVSIHGFQDGFFPYEGAQIKAVFEQLKRESPPDLIFTHHGADLHQDHRTASELTWNTFRDHLILEYEIPKYDGGLTSPNVFVRLDEATHARKIEYLMQAFGSQRSKRWFTDDTFSAMMHLRGVEIGSASAEGFHVRKLTLTVPDSHEPNGRPEAS